MRMNRIEILRESVGKIARMLTSSGIKVTQRGHQAYVSHRNGIPERLNVPVIPDNADEKLIHAVQGFIDHEVGHILFSDFNQLANAIKESKKLGNLLNITEDIRIEKMMGRKFRGTPKNLGKMYDYWVPSAIESVYEEALKSGDPNRIATTLFVPMARALGGQQDFVDFMSDKMHHVQGVINLLPKDIAKQLQNMETPEDAERVARIMLDAIEEPPQQDGTPEEEEQEQDSQNNNSKDNKDENKENGDESQEGDESEQGQEGDQNAQEGDDQQEGDDSEGQGDDESQDEDSGSDSEDEDDGTGGGDEGEQEDDESDGDSGGDGDNSGDQDGDSDGESESDGEGDSEGDSAGGDDNETQGGSQQSDDLPEEIDYEDMKDLGGDAQVSGQDVNIDLEDLEDFDDSMSKVIEKALADAATASDYTIFSNDYDRVYTPSDFSNDSSDISRLTDPIEGVTRSMQKELQRLMMAQRQSVNIGGFRSGKLRGSALHRLSTGDDRVFQKKHERREINTAVSLVIDLSGSMNAGAGNGYTCMQVALQSAYAFADILSRLDIDFEVMGFSTQFSQEQSQDNKFWNEYKRFLKGTHTPASRTEGVIYYMFKDFNSKFGQMERRAMATAHERDRGKVVKIDNNTNIDGEAIDFAVKRLKKTDAVRRIVMVFSDGMPNCSTWFSGMQIGDTSEIYAHHRKVIKDAERDGVEIIGIGLDSDCVEKLYKKSCTLNDVTDLPQVVMRELKAILLQ